jgi:deoxyribodipyrimidine photo-lyase
MHRIWKPFLEEQYTQSPPVTQHWQQHIHSDMQPEDGTKQLKLDTSLPNVNAYKGGQQEARKKLSAFIQHGLPHYHTDRNDPANNLCSNMSPYLHFGHIAALDIAKMVIQVDACKEAKDTYLEELIVRRELSMNFVYFNTGYDQFSKAVPEWAQKTLQKHARDKRTSIYSKEDLDAGDTHDPYWNAAQKEMVYTGKMHNYMRMYWGKKVIEWSKSPEEAFDILIAMNDRYELDGRDANGYTGVAWCFGKHDRPWTERDIFGTVRYMAASGLERKFNIDGYVSRVNEAISE